jgi:hypothetical protein
MEDEGDNWGSGEGDDWGSDNGGEGEWGDFEHADGLTATTADPAARGGRNEQSLDQKIAEMRDDHDARVWNKRERVEAEGGPSILQQLHDEELEQEEKSAAQEAKYAQEREVQKRRQDELERPRTTNDLLDWERKDVAFLIWQRTLAGDNHACNTYKMGDCGKCTRPFPGPVQSQCEAPCASRNNERCLRFKRDGKLTCFSHRRHTSQLSRLQGSLLEYIAQLASIRPGVLEAGVVSAATRQRQLRVVERTKRDQKKGSDKRRK